MWILPERYRVPSLGLALLVAAAPATLAATKNASGEAVYRCRDARGQSHFGQAIPEKCLDQDVEVLDSSGRVVRVIPGRRSLEQVAQQKAAELIPAIVAWNREFLSGLNGALLDVPGVGPAKLSQLREHATV